MHIGFNLVDPDHYDGWSGPLNACEADAHAMAAICAARGFSARKLLTRDATRLAVTDAFASAARELTAGDTFVISYSGHGGQLPDQNRDEDDGLDETWCLFDGQIVVDELYQLWATFAAGVRIAVFSDSCHSGTVVKDQMLLRAITARSLAGAAQDVAAYRAMPNVVAARAYNANRDFYDELLARPAPPPPVCSLILVSGCQDNQLSMDGPFNGAFTGALLQTWDGGAFRGSYNALATAVRAKLPPTQSPKYMTLGVQNETFERGQALTI